MKSFKALSLLLSYPTAEILAALPGIRAVLHDEGLFGPRRMAGIDHLISHLGQLDLYEAEEQYVMLFDRSRTLSLNLFEHLHGESRDRGGAMVELLELYRAGGFDLAATELPDHLPVLLEFLSTQPAAVAEDTLADAAAILTALAERLTRRQSPYAAVFEALAAHAGADGNEAEAAILAAQPDDDPEDLAALDAAYAEAQVVFGPDPNAGCPSVRDMLARMDHPAPRAAN